MIYAPIIVKGGELARGTRKRIGDVHNTLIIQDSSNLAELGGFCRKMGREANQGEVGLVVGDEYFAIRNFAGE